MNESESSASTEEEDVQQTMAMAGPTKKWTLDLDADDLQAQLKLFKYKHSKYLKVANITDPAKQAASFIQELPDEATTLIMEYDWATAGKSEDSIDDVIEMLCKVKTKKSSKIVARHKLLTRFMKKGERFTEFKKALFMLAEQCGYEKTQKEQMIRDLIISRHSDEPLQKQLLMDLADDTTLEQVITLCERNKHSKDATKEFHKPGTSHQVNAALDKREKKKEKRNENEKGKKDGLWRCDKFCGGYHVRGAKNCKAFGTTCAKCGKQNHYEEVCRERQPLPGWKPKNKASEENHKKVVARAYAATEEESETESQRDNGGEDHRKSGYDTDLDPVKSDSDDDMRRPARRVDRVAEKLVITARQERDLRNTLEKRGRETSGRKRYEGETISNVQANKKKMFSPNHRHRDEELERRSRGRDRSTPPRRRSPSPARQRREKRERQEEKRQRSPEGEPSSKQRRSERRRSPENRVEKREARKPEPASEPKKRLKSEVKVSERTRNEPEPKKKDKNEQELNYEISDEDYDTVSEKRKVPRLWDENVAIGGRTVRMKVDSGSTINTMSLKTFQRLRFSESVLEPCDIVIRTYSQTQMEPLGQFRATLSLRGRRTRATFLLLEEDVPALLGLPSGYELGLFHKRSEPRTVHHPRGGGRV